MAGARPADAAARPRCGGDEGAARQPESAVARRPLVPSSVDLSSSSSSSIIHASLFRRLYARACAMSSDCLSTHATSVGASSTNSVPSGFAEQEN